MRSSISKKVLLIVSIQIIFSNAVKSQSDSTVLWQGSIRAKGNNAVIPHATIASYKQITTYIADEIGNFSLRLSYNDSIRVAALGFNSRTIVLKEMPQDSLAMIKIELNQHSFMIKEVTVKGYQGILDPLIFPKYIDDSPKIDLHLPNNIGSRISKVPPNERPDAGNMNALGAVFSPASFIYSKVNRTERSKAKLPEVRQQSKLWNHKEAIAGRGIIAAISGYVGEELDKFMIYCNIHLKISAADNALSATRKITALLEEYKARSK
jgi:hypothetical protein